MITKIQYNNYEPGEFTDIKDRTAPETIDLITNFPWTEQRDHLVVGLTNPGITIEGSNNDYLKLAPYYHGKFVLHYLDPTTHLYNLSFDHLSDAIPVIQSFFDTPDFDPSGFHKELTLLQQLTPHFVTQDFRYPLDRGRVFACILIFLLPLLFILLISIAAAQQPAMLLFVLPVAILLFFGIALFINHYRAAKGKVLIVSKGHDEFAYGPIDNPKNFSKKDILSITTYGNRGRGNQYGLMTEVEIDFTNGTSIELSCLMLRQDVLVAKFPQAPKSDEAKIFPFISRDASALSG